MPRTLEHWMTPDLNVPGKTGDGMVCVGNGMLAISFINMLYCETVKDVQQSSSVYTGKKF